MLKVKQVLMNQYTTNVTEPREFLFAWCKCYSNMVCVYCMWMMMYLLCCDVVFRALHWCKPFCFTCFTFVNVIGATQSLFMELVILVYKKKKKLKIFTLAMGHQDRACFLLGLGFTILNVAFCVKKHARFWCPVVYVKVFFILHLWFTCIFLFWYFEKVGIIFL